MNLQSDEIVDAEFESLGRTGSTGGTTAPNHTPDAPPAHGLGLFRAGATEKRGGRPMPLPAFAAIATLSACASFYVAGGHVFFHGIPTPSPTQAAVPVTPVVLDGATTRVDTSGGRAVIVVRAGLRNTGTTATTAPSIAITFDRADGSGSVTHTVSRGERLAPGERMAFTTRIPAGDYGSVEPRIALTPSH
ncbi:MAG: hypothetical protein RIB53_00545 [Roseitalea porphyridii]|uniref:hypothetical protein n=1 Tax=Roseitalea porphyridii TaxID=1852022 RepID=UPI0032EF01A4